MEPLFSTMLNLDMAVTSLEKAKTLTASSTGLILNKNNSSNGGGGAVHGGSNGNLARTIQIVENAVEFCPQVTHLAITTIHVPLCF